MMPNSWFRYGLILLLMLQACSQKHDPELGEGIFARVNSSKGEFILQLAYQRAPLTVANFIGLAEGLIPNKFRPTGEPFFDGLSFHRVDEGFVIQGGDPLGSGFGGPGYFFRQETHPELSHNVAGTVGMANVGPGTNGSQWYITLRAAPELDGSYNVFGYVVVGMEVVQEIRKGDNIDAITIIRQGEEATQFDALKVWHDMKEDRG